MVQHEFTVSRETLENYLDLLYIPAKYFGVGLDIFEVLRVLAILHPIDSWNSDLRAEYDAMLQLQDMGIEPDIVIATTQINTDMSKTFVSYCIRLRGLISNLEIPSEYYYVQDDVTNEISDELWEYFSKLAYSRLKTVLDIEDANIRLEAVKVLPDADIHIRLSPLNMRKILDYISAYANDENRKLYIFNKDTRS